MRFQCVADWLHWQQQLHPSAIDLGTERVQRVGRAMGVLTPDEPVISVAGTNGKGSTVAFLEGLATETGYRPGSFTSPHILAYNERIRIDGQPVDDATLLAAFDAVDRARGATTLSFFEFGALAALWCFRERDASPWLLEVGLGGRLDAVNALDAEVAVVTSIAMDHADWLGSDLDTIATEKAGIMRAQRPAVCGEREPPLGLLSAGAAHGATLVRRGRDFDAQRQEGGWRWIGRNHCLEDLPLPAWAGDQMDNAATALAAWEAAEGKLIFPSSNQAAAGIASARLAGRLDWVDDEWLLDVAHNPAAAERLGSSLAQLEPARPRRAVFGIMARKDLAGVVNALAPVIDVWHPLVLPDDDACSLDAMVGACHQAGGRVGQAGSPEALLPAVAALPGTKLACGSFRTVEEVMRWYRTSTWGRSPPSEMRSCNKG